MTEEGHSLEARSKKEEIAYLNHLTIISDREG